jgi:hypothetical protein
MNLSRNHISFTLGIPVPLNESIQLNKELTLRILQEQLLYETFLDSIKDYTKDKFNTVVDTINDWKDAAVVLGKVLSDGKLLNDFLYPLERRVNRLIQPLTDFLKKNKLDSFVKTITDFIDKIKSLEGWKKFMALISVGSIITYILEKLKSLGPDVIKNFISKIFSSNFITDVVGKLTDFKSYLGWLQPIVKGVETIFNFLKPLIDAFSKAFQSGSKFATKLIKENKIPIKMKKQQLKYIIKEELKKIIKEEPVFKGNTTTKTNIPSDVKNLDKAQSSSSQVKAKAKAINNIAELPGAFENWFKTLGFQPLDGEEDGKYKISKSQIITSITKVLVNKLGYK